MNAINVQDRLRVAAEYEAEGNKVKQVKAAEANAEETIIQAQAEADAKYQQGLGTLKCQCRRFSLCPKHISHC